MFLCDPENVQIDDLVGKRFHALYALRKEIEKRGYVVLEAPEHIWKLGVQKDNSRTVHFKRFKNHDVEVTKIEKVCCPRCGSDNVCHHHFWWHNHPIECLECNERWYPNTLIDIDYIAKLEGQVRDLKAALSEAIYYVTRSRIGTIETGKVYTPQVDVKTVDRWRKALNNDN